jgi:hypothetical protein
MRGRRAAISALLSILLLALTVPAASAGAARTDFVGFVFPAGMFGTSCSDFGGIFVSAPLPGCVLDAGTTIVLRDGRALIRDEVVVDMALAAREQDDLLAANYNEPRRTGYNVETFNANFDATLSGPAWGSWEFYNFDNELMFRGTFTGSFANGAPTMRTNGVGVGAYAGQHVWLDVLPGEYVNVSGMFLEPGSVADAH